MEQEKKEIRKRVSQQSRSTRTGWKWKERTNPKCSECDQENPNKICSQCGMVYYCSQECQRKAWPGHKDFCRVFKLNFNPSRNDGLRTLLFDQGFGAFYTIYEHFALLRRGPGVVLVELSHEAEVFARHSPPSEGEHRKLIFSYKEKANIAELDKLYNYTMLPKDEHDEPHNLMVGLLEMTDSLNRRFSGGSFLSLVVIGPQNSWMMAYQMASWLSPDHKAFKAMNSPQFGEDGMVFDWEDDRRWMIDVQVVGNNFYRQCMAHHQQRKEAKGDEKSPFHPRWEAVFPPLAQHLAVMQAPPNAK